MALAAAKPSVLVAGPTRLLHANYDRRAGVVFTKVPLPAGAAPSCLAGTPVAWDGESDLEVSASEVICVGSARRVNLAWHARTVTPPFPAGVQHASLP